MKNLPASRHLFLTITWIYFLIFSFPVIGQIQPSVCVKEVPIFSGIPETTLCEEYGEQSHPFEIGSGTDFPESSLIGSNITNREVLISGDFYIDNNFRFVNCTIKISPGVSLTLLTPSTPATSFLFVIDNSKLFSCSSLWDGIIMWPNTSIMTRNHTVIEDASTAIRADYSTCALFIDDTRFNRNNVGIRMIKSNNHPHGGLIYRFNRNIFECTAPLNGTQDQVSYAGLWITNNNYISIKPYAEAASNQFTGLQYGILADGNNTIINCEWFRFNELKIAGIHVQNGFVDLRFCRFYNCEIGLSVNALQNLHVKNCIFEFDDGLTYDENLLGFQIRDGIYIHSFFEGSYCKIEASRFDANFSNEFRNVRGIHLGGGAVAAGTRVIIENNGWEFISVLSPAIYITGIFPSNSSVDIENNTFNVDMPFYSYESEVIKIADGNKNGFDIIGNTLYNSNAIYAYNGINLVGSNGSNNRLIDNLFGPTIVVNSFHRGVVATNFDNTMFCSNHFYNTRTAFLFSGLNEETNLVTNDIYSGAFIHLTPKAWIDDQIQNANTWELFPGEPLFAIFPAYMEEPDDNSLFSNFEVHTQQSTAISGPGFNEYHPLGISPDDEDEWWSYVVDTPKDDCLDELPNPYVSELKKVIADDEIFDFLLDSNLEWQAKRGLFNTMYNDTALISLYSSFPTYYSDYLNSPAGQLFRVDKLIDSLLCSPIAIFELISEQLTEYDSMIVVCSLLDSILSISNDSLITTTSPQAKLNLVNYIGGIVDSIHALEDQYNSIIIEELDSLLAMNYNIVPGNHLESSEQLVLGIYINLMKTDTVSEAERDTLLILANECPLVYGHAVYNARGLLEDCYDSHISDRGEDCFSEPEETVFGEDDRFFTSSLQDEHNRSALTTIFPNPASSQLTTLFSNSQIAELVIVDQIGRIHFTEMITSGKTIELNHFASGVYFVRINLLNGTNDIKRLVIAK